VCAPTHVFQAKGGTGQDTRKDVEKQAANLRWGNMLLLPGEWEHRIDAAKAEFVDVTENIVEWAYTMWAVGVTGNAAAIKPATGFANLDFYAVTERNRRAFLAGCVVRQLCEQGVKWYVADNWGPSIAIPVGDYDTKSPADKLAESEAFQAEGAAIEALRDGYDAVAYELEPAWIEERAQRKGIRVRRKAGAPQVARLNLGVEQVGAVVMGVEARAAEGLSPFGDERDRQTVAELQNAGKGGGAAAVAPKPPTSPGGPSPAQHPPAARLENEDCDEEDDEDCDEDARRASLAAGLAGSRSCEHGRTHTCPRCGVARVYAPPSQGPEGPVYRVEWRPIRRKRVAAAA
jgi:hypothetical protein